MCEEYDLQRHLLQRLKKINAKADQLLSTSIPKKRRELSEQLERLKQGSMSVEEYFEEVELAMIGAGMKETPKATVNRFVNGLNPEVSCFARRWSFMDIEILVPFGADYERSMKKKHISEEKSNSKKSDTTIVSIHVPDKEVTTTKEEEHDVEEDLFISCVNPINHERNSEFISEGDFSNNKKNYSEDEDKQYVNFVDVDNSFSGVILSTLQDLKSDDSSKNDLYGEYDNQESRTTLLQEGENDMILGDIIYKSLQGPDSLQDTMRPIARSFMNGDVIKAPETTFGLQFATTTTHYVCIHVEDVNGILTMSIQTHIHCFTTHKSMSTWQGMKIHEIGVT